MEMRIGLRGYIGDEDEDFHETRELEVLVKPFRIP